MLFKKLRKIDYDKGVVDDIQFSNFLVCRKVAFGKYYFIC